MRLKIRFDIPNPADQPIVLPYNYQYEVSALIYRMIERNNPELSAWLHQSGYTDGYKKFKFFHFSRFFLPPHHTKPYGFVLHENYLDLILSFYTNDIPQNIIESIFRDHHAELVIDRYKLQLEVHGIECLPVPVFLPEMDFRTLSPVLLSKSDMEITRHPIYISPLEADFKTYFFRNLITKYNTACKYLDLPEIEVNPNLLNFELIRLHKEKIIALKQNRTDETKVRCYEMDFKITAPEHLMRIGYYAGFGERNPMGLGCCEII